MSITQITEQEQRLTNTLRLTTEALRAVTAERDALAESDKGLREVVENLQAGIKHWRDEWSDRCDDNQGLVNERDALRADAERYRWIRQCSNDSLIMHGDSYNCELMMEEELDAAIDAAMKGKS